MATTGPNPTLKPINIGEPRELSRDDLPRLFEGSRTGANIARLRESHHKIARFAAMGLNSKQIAAYVGMSPERVRALREAPAMIELVARYREQVEEKENEAVDAYLDLKAQNMLAAERHIADRIDELDAEGQLLSIREALAISADGADRTGYGKRSTNVNINYDFATKLEAAIKRSGKVIEGSVTRPPPQPLATSFHGKPTPQEAVAPPLPILRRA